MSYVREEGDRVLCQERVWSCAMLERVWSCLMLERVWSCAMLERVWSCLMLEKSVVVSYVREECGRVVC